MLTTIVALPDEFPEHLAGYCQQATAAAKANKHHDYRRALLIDFLRKAGHRDDDSLVVQNRNELAKIKKRLEKALEAR